MNTQDFIQKTQEGIPRMVKDRRILVACSGGRESTITAKLCLNALPPDQVVPIHFPFGLGAQQFLPRLHEAIPDVIVWRHVLVTDTADAAMRQTSITRRRRVFRDGYRDCLQAAAQHYEATFIGQGTIIDDLVRHREAAEFNPQNNADLAVPDCTMIEPLAELSKKQCIPIAQELGLSAAFWDETYFPFPGPGRLLRVTTGQPVTPDMLDVLERIDPLIWRAFYPVGAYQAFAIIGPPWGDGYSVIVRAVKLEGNDASVVWPGDAWRDNVAENIMLHDHRVKKVLFDITPRFVGCDELFGGIEWRG